MKASRRLLWSPTAEQKSILTKCPCAPVDLQQEKQDMKLMSGMVSIDPFNADVGVSQDSIFILSFFHGKYTIYSKQPDDIFSPKEGR